MVNTTSAFPWFRACELGERLPDVQYTVDGRPKRVKWWTMTVVEELGRIADPDEVDEVRWVDVEDLARLGLRPSDLATVDAALALR